MVSALRKEIHVQHLGLKIQEKLGFAGLETSRIEEMGVLVQASGQECLVTKQDGEKIDMLP